MDDRSVERTNVGNYLKVFDRNTNRPVGLVADITPEGIGIFGDMPLNPGTVLRGRLSPMNRIDTKKKKRSGNEIDFDAEVVWCNKDKSIYLDEVYDSGYKFLSLPEGTIDSIRQLIEQISFDFR